MVKLWANGCARKVIVDDRLPVDRNGELLCACSKDRAELWVSIIEKVRVLALRMHGRGPLELRPHIIRHMSSDRCRPEHLHKFINTYMHVHTHTRICIQAYMKLHGASYDFKGSNSGVDLFSLTGWIPEQVFFQEDETGAASSAKRTPAAGTEGGKQRPPPPVLDHRQSAERAWERLQSAFRFGDCLTTIATSASLGEKEAEALGLVPGHAYAVLDVRECLGKRFLLVRLGSGSMRWEPLHLSAPS